MLEGCERAVNLFEELPDPLLVAPLSEAERKPPIGNDLRCTGAHLLTEREHTALTRTGPE